MKTAKILSRKISRHTVLYRSYIPYPAIVDVYGFSKDINAALE